MRIENVNSDLELVVRFMVGTVEVKVPTHDFCLRFRTVGNYGTYFDCKQEKGVLVNCEVNPGRTRLTCNLDNHGLRVGELECEFYDYIPSADFTDGTRRVVVPCGMDVRLAKDATAPDDVDVDVVLGITSWISSELFVDDFKIKEPDYTYSGYYISSDNNLITANDSFTLLVFEVNSWEHWRVERINSAQSTGWLCALYSDQIDDPSVFTDAGDEGVRSCMLANYKGKSLYKNYPLVIGDEHNEGWDNVIPPGAKWLVVTKYSSAEMAITEVDYMNALDKVDDFAEIYDARLENLHDKLKWDVYTPQLRFVSTEGSYVPLGNYDEVKEHYSIYNRSYSGHTAGDTEYDSNERFYDLYAFHVHSGERWRVYREQSLDNQPPVYYALVSLYKLERMCDESTEDLVLTPEAYVGVGDPSENNVRVGCDEVIDIPDGVGLMVVQFTPTIRPATLSVSKYEPVYIKDRLEDIIDGDLSDDALPTQPYTMKASRNGTTTTILSKPSGSDQEYIFVFDESMNNKLMSLWGVYGRDVTDDWDMGTTGAVSLMNNNSADSIGPIAIRGTNYQYEDFIGGNHPISRTTVKTARTLNWSVVAHRRNGEHSLNDGKEMMCDAVTLKAVHLISRPTLPATAQSTLLPTLLETVTITVRENRAEVEVRHDYPFELPEGAVVWDYYGMQSVFGSTSSMLIKTPDGPLTSWTSEDELVTVPDNNNQKRDYTISKVEYPLLSQFIQKNSAGWCQSAHIDRWHGIGDRSINGAGNTFNENLSMRLAWQSGKVYHRLIGGHPLSRGESYSWRGTYSWWKEEE